VLALVIAVHGLALALGSVTLARAEHPALQALGEAYYFIVVAPALLLALPLNPILWSLRLMEAPGWFAWPKPLGFVLVYAVWSSGLFALSLLAAPRK